MSEQDIEENTDIVEENQEVEEVQQEEQAPEITEELLAAREKAKSYGWRAKEDFDLAPDGWVDADRFLEMPSTQNKMLRDDMRKQKDEFAERISRMEAANKTALDRSKEAQEAIYQQKLADIQAQQRAAVEEADTEAFDRLEASKASLTAPKTEEPVQEGPSETDQQVIADYFAKNDWVNDPVMKSAASAAIENNPAIKAASAQAQLEYGERMVREYFPHKFEQPKTKPKRSMVDSGGLGGVTATAQKLPPEAQKAGKEFIEQGIFKNMEEYTKAYFAEGNSQ